MLQSGQEKTLILEWFLICLPTLYIFSQLFIQSCQPSWVSPYPSHSHLSLGCWKVLLLLLPLLLSHFSRVRLCATPETAAHQAPLSLGFSRQEHWSGLPFPSPTHESEKWKWSRSVVSDPQRPHGLQPSRLLRPQDFPGKSGVPLLSPAIEWGVIAFSEVPHKLTKNQNNCHFEVPSCLPPCNNEPFLN